MADYEARVTAMADALHEDCRLEWQAIAVVDPGRAITQHGPDAHYGRAHDLVRRLSPSASEVLPTATLDVERLARAIETVNPPTADYGNEASAASGQPIYWSSWAAAIAAEYERHAAPSASEVLPTATLADGARDLIRRLTEVRHLAIFDGYTAPDYPCDCATHTDARRFLDERAT